jgi:uncharacterized repeat protein (TIGR03803 family)
MTTHNSTIVKRLKASLPFAFLVFAMHAVSFGQVEKTIFVFNGTTEGGYPGGGLVADSSGALYGTTMKGGSASMGTVFKLSPPAVKGAAWTESILYSFQGGTTDGAMPYYVTPVFDSHGNLYGTTYMGGANNAGTVFQLTPPSGQGGSWTESLLFSFQAHESPLAGVTLNSAGAIFGALQSGQVYQLSPSGGTWVYSVIYEQSYPITSNLTLSKGILFGAIPNGGSFSGQIFTLEKGSNGEWESNTLWSFFGPPNDGSQPESTITLASGVAYGTTAYGGSSGVGAVYSLSASGGGDTILYSFMRGDGGSNPNGGVIFGSKGQLYGTTSAGGSANLGTIFKLTPPTVKGNPWTYTLLHTFSGTNNDYGQPQNTLLLRSGVFYGTTPGGANNAGTVFELIQ